MTQLALPLEPATPVDISPGTVERLLDVERIYLEPGVPGWSRGREILDRFPDAEQVEVPSHWQIPGLHGNEGNVADWLRIKRGVLVLGEKKGLTTRRNGRSADWIAPSTANGCAMACSYCYVPRRKGYANPITVFVNIEKVLAHLERHVVRQGPKTEPNQCDPVDWVYDIGESSDCSVDALLSANVADLVGLFARLDGAKASFATKFVNPALLDLDPRGGTRIRFSLMPADVSRRVDLRTTPVAKRIAAIDDFVAAGYEVHVNLSPVIVHDGWLEAWDELLTQLDDRTGTAAKEQLAAEVIFLTHNEALHEVNLGWHPRGEELLWRPDIQQVKRSESGARNLRYHPSYKRGYVDELLGLIERRTPWLRVRYAF